MIFSIAAPPHTTGERMQPFEIKLEHIRRSYLRPVLTDINLTLNNASYTAIVGKSGSGKSTLMNILGLLESFDGGSYTFDGEEIVSGKDYHKLRLSKFGFIYQSYNLVPTLTCEENILLPTLYAGTGAGNLDYVVQTLGIEQLLKVHVNVLSGGEKQRVAIARALILDPALLIADEPTGNLDPANREVVFDLFESEHKKGRGIVMITHDAAAAARAQMVYQLEDGILKD